jgi:hypothetical protein
MIGCLLAAATYFPIFKAMTHYANPDLEAAQQTSPVIVIADPLRCSFQFNPVGTAKFVTSCDIAKAFLAKNSVSYRNEVAPAGAIAVVKVGETVVQGFEGRVLAKDDFKKRSEEFNKALGDAVKGAGYPAKADMGKVNYVMVGALLTILVIYVTMVYGPIAAWLVELFPARIRYTSLSLPYHIGNGWFGGFLPTTTFAMVAATGDIYYGLWYPVVIAIMTAVLGTLFLPETKDRAIHHDA